MSWVRLEDSFTSHPKIMELSDADFRVWIRLLCHCAKVKDPSVDAKTRKEVGGLTAGRVKRFESLGLLDQQQNSHEVHDWTHYAPKDASSAERVRAFRARRSVTEALPQALPPRDRDRVQNEGRPRDEVWDALVDVLKTSPETKSERGRWNVAVKELREAGANPEEIRRRAKAYHRRYPDAALTPTALSANWGSLASKAPIVALCEHCGVGGGRHTKDCPVVKPFEDEDVERVIALARSHNA